MQTLLNNPAIQSGIVPFIIALVVLLVLRPLKGYWACLALAIAFYCSVYLVVGFQFTPLTSTRKLYLLGIIATGLGVVMDNFPIQRRHTITLIGVLSAAAALWVLWPVLLRKEGMMLWLSAIGSVVYVVWLTTQLERHRLEQPAIYAGVFAIGIGTGLSALLGASALLGQLASSVGAASGAFILLSLFNKNIPTGTTFTFPAALLCGLIGVSAIMYAQLPWYSLIMLAAIPMILNYPIAPRLSKPSQLLIMCALTLLLAAAAIGATWKVTGPPPL